MYDVKVINNWMILYENDVDMINLEHLRNNDNIRYDSPMVSIIGKICLWLLILMVKENNLNELNVNYRIIYLV